MNADADSLGRQDLGDTFAPSTDRAANLKRLKPKARATAAPAVQDAPELPEPDAETPPAAETRSTTTPAPAPVAEPASGPVGEAPDAAESEKNINYQVYVPSHILSPFKKARSERGTSNAFLVFDAIEELVDAESDDPYARLRELVQADLLTSSAPSSSLFARAPRRRSTAADLGPRVPLMLRVTPSNKKALEALVHDTGAVDRGHLATVALVHHLKIKEAGRS